MKRLCKFEKTWMSAKTQENLCVHVICMNEMHRYIADLYMQSYV